MTKKNVLIAIIIFLAINLLSWLIWGRSQTLVLAAHQFKTASTCFVDTVNVFTETDSDHSWYTTEIGDYSDKTISKFENAFQYKTFSLKLHPTTYENGRDKLPKYLSYENCVYTFTIMRTIPMYARVESGALAGDGSATYRGSYIWFLRWWKLSERQTGVS